MQSLCGSCGRGTEHVEGRCQTCGGPWSPPELTFQHKALNGGEPIKVSEYEKGWLDCLYLYAWMKDGTMYVGWPGRLYAAAARDFLIGRGKILKVDMSEIAT